MLFLSALFVFDLQYLLAGWAVAFMQRYIQTIVGVITERYLLHFMALELSTPVFSRGQLTATVAVPRLPLHDFCYYQCSLGDTAVKCCHSTS